MIAGCRLDHVALAVERHADVLDLYRDRLGGDLIGGGPDPGFVWAQLAYANGMRLELLEPHDVERFDFLRRFLDRNGPGPHHMTFKVDDIEAGIAEARAAGYEVVNVHLDGPTWKEAFLHPKSGPGVVIQLAWSDHSHDGGAGSPCSLLHVAHTMADLRAAERLFVGLLGGEITGRHSDDAVQSIDIAWPGPGRVRVSAPTGSGPVADWLGDRTGRVSHLLFACPDPASIPGATAGPEGTFVVDPQRNFGTRLVLHPS